MVPSGLRAIREGVAWAALDSYAVLHVPGREARAALGRVSPLPLSLREGQALQTLFLHADARPFADVMICNTASGYTLFCEGPAPTELAGWLTENAACSVEVQNNELRLFALTGPYAWQLVGELVGKEVYALPTLFHHRFGAWGCLRAGKTGEYCYLLTVPRGQCDAFLSRLQEVGADFDLAPATALDLAQAALETWNFNIFREGQAQGVTPIELQLQWRVSFARTSTYPGADALRKRQQEGVTQRLTMLLGQGDLIAGDTVFCGDAPIGVIVNAGYCAIRREWAAMALLNRPFAVSGIHAYHAEHDGSQVSLRTASPPVICQRSLFVTPGQHTYRNRNEYRFPPP